MDYLFRGILIGMIFGLPAGAVGAMTVQRTWNRGFRAGLLTGLGSSAADCFYAAVGAFGLTIVSDFLMAHSRAITIAGGLFVLYIGIRLIFRNEEVIRQEERTEKNGNIFMFLTSFAVGITNPAAILTFLFAFTYFGISDISGPAEGIFLVTGVLTGTFLWWIFLAAITCSVRKKTSERKRLPVNRFFGGILVLFAAVIFLRLL